MQVVQEAERADLSDEEGIYPTRAYATLDLLERQLLGLRQQLCQVSSPYSPSLLTPGPDSLLALQHL